MISWTVSAILLAVALFLIYKKLIKPLREARKNTKNVMKRYRGLERSEPSVKLVAYLHKDCSMVCLQEDGKHYGSTFKNGEPPKLPHCDGCRCSYQNVFPHHSRMFSEKQDEAHYDTDIGKLDFYQYKYYKYSLMMRHSQGDSLYDECKEFRDNLEVSEEFRQTVISQLT